MSRCWPGSGSGRWRGGDEDRLLKIVDVNEFYSPTGGGVRTYVDRKMRLLAELGHELTVIAPAKADAVEERPGGRIHWVATPPMPFDRNYRLFGRAAPVHALLDRLRPDVVEVSSPWRPAWIVAGWPGDAVRVFFWHNDNVAAYPMRWFEGVASPARIERAFAWYSRYIARFLPAYDAVVTNGPALAKRLRARGLRVDAELPLGIEAGHFSPALRDEALRAELLAACGLGPEAVLLLGIGRHHPEKRWPLVIRAARAAGERAPIGLVQLGAGLASGPVARAARGAPHVRLLPPEYDRTRLAAIMASADALVHGSEAEPFGLVAVEAVASGLPLIVPDAGGSAEAAVPGASLHYRARDEAALTRAILAFATGDRAALRAVAVEASAHVRTDRDHVRDLLACYEAVLGRRRTKRLPGTATGR